MSKKARQVAFSHKVGKDIAHQAKMMTDSEWEAVPLVQKQHFTQYIGRLIREKPSEVTEQQRRRYFETTMVDPRELDPSVSVKDTYERIKLGLPVNMKDMSRQLGVSQAMYEASDASLFDPNNAHRLENAMTELRQLFTDYVKKKREGVSTEAERRKLANLSADLNKETQQHLGNMFKYAEYRLKQLIKEEKHKQLERIEDLRQRLQERRQRDNPAEKSSAMKAQKIRQIMKNAYGLDYAVAEKIVVETKAQEDFMAFCEVLLRMTKKTGFTHSAADERLDAYVESIKNLYSVDATAFSTLDAVQYMAAKENTAPMHWAKRWFEKALLLPLEETPEFKTLMRIQNQELEALRADKVPEHVEAADAHVAKALVSQTAAERHAQVINLVDKMFLHPNDRRLATIHEKRLRYLSYLQMESQIKRVRKISQQFAGVENLPAAEECRELYNKLMERRQALNPKAQPEASDPQQNIFLDSECRELFERIQAIVKQTMKEVKYQSEAARKARRLNELLRLIKGTTLGPDGEPISPEQRLQAIEQECLEKKKGLLERIMRLVERDVREDIAFVESMEEADRPPLLPIPEPMSYVSAADVIAWKSTKEAYDKNEGNPFKSKNLFQPTFMGHQWRVPDKPLLFWGTGITALRQGLEHAAEDAERRRNGEDLVPPYPCPENPWGWRLVKDVLDD